MPRLLLYCVKAKPYLVSYNNTNKHWYLLRENEIKPFPQLNTYNGKIIAECDFEVEEINCSSVFNHCYATWNLGQEELLKFSCLERKQLVDYLGYENQIDGKWCGYAIHIKNLHIFDEPRELYDCLIYPKIEPRYYGCEHLSKAPQNMMYVELDDIKYILISIQPQWLCKILNGDKTIEVRKKVLKEMMNNE